MLHSSSACEQDDQVSLQHIIFLLVFWNDNTFITQKESVFLLTCVVDIYSDVLLNLTVKRVLVYVCEG